MKVLFLDIDGVLNSTAFFKRDDALNMLELDPIAVDMMLDVVSRASANIVLSSTWRLVPELVENLRRAGIPIYAITPRGDAFNVRSDEIAAWLSAHGDGVEAFAIVDDDPDAGYGLERHFVRTDYNIGLTQADADRLAVILGVEL